MPSGPLFLINEGSPRNYRFRGKLTCADPGVPSLAYGVSRLEFGRPYSTVVQKHGLEIEILNDRDLFNNPTYQILLNIPALSVVDHVVDSGSSWLTPDDWEMQIDDFEESAAECGAWEVDWSELRIYVRGSGTAAYTRGPDNFSGDDYDTRYNGCTGFAYAALKDVLVSEPFEADCDLVAGDVLDDPTYKFGWQRDVASVWTSETIDVGSAFSPPSPDSHGTCFCSDTVASTAVVNSWDCDVTAFWQRLKDRDFVETVHCCPCPEDPTNCADFDVDDIEDRQRSGSSWLMAAPTTQGILKHQRLGQSVCYDLAYFVEGGTPPMTTSDSGVVTEAHTLAPYYKCVDNIIGIRDCAAGDGLLLICRDYQASPENCYEFSVDSCRYFGSVTQIWPDRLPCGGSDPSHDVSLAGRHARAFVSGGTIRIGFAAPKYPLTFSTLDTGIAATSVCVRYDLASIECRVYIYYSNGTNVYSRYSINEGSTWSAAVLIGAGTNGRAEITRAGIRYIYRLDGTTIYGEIRNPADVVMKSTFTVKTGVSGLGELREDFDRNSGEWRIVLTYTSGGNIYSESSIDGVTFS